jgi:hypothetical protein
MQRILWREMINDVCHPRRVTDDLPASFSLHAWVDESIQAPRGEQPGVYYLAAAVANPDECGSTREALRGLVRRRHGRLHWRDELPDQQEKIAVAIGAQDLAHVIVVGTPVDPRRQERARRLCMQRLLFELDQLGIVQVWLESRHDSLNRRDVVMLDALRSNGAISKVIRVDFGKPKDDPMLWVPDAVAGIVSLARRGRRMELRDALGKGVDEIAIDL